MFFFLRSESVVILLGREFRGAIAVAVEKRNAMTMIAGRWLAIGRAASSIAA